ncbi:MAG: GNAT family N-acetyltransferase [Tissierellia bacterium]|nr:GNAT family N-acetyltransferase [Tissierellia bacterium]
MIKLAEKGNLDRIVKIIEDGKEALRDMGINQWQDGYPDRDVLAADIDNQELYIYLEDGEIISVMTLLTDYDNAYDTLVGGEWKGKTYIAVHRLSVAREHKGKGISKKMISYAIEKASEMGLDSIRIDTHMENTVVKNISDSFGFEYKGVIEFDEGGKGIAYEKMLERKFGVYTKKFEELSNKEIYDILRLRQNVFMIEQDIKFEDIDGLDPFCIHIFAYIKDKLAGYIRVIPERISFEEPSMGRYCVCDEMRGLGIGGELFERAINYIHDIMEKPIIRIHAQSYLAEPYRRAGFEIVGEEYILEGLPHVEMVKIKNIEN